MANKLNQEQMRALNMEIRDLKGQCLLLERDLSTAHAKANYVILCYVM